jgi:raffinose/stachyose/melibiose transport system permease protein
MNLAQAKAVIFFILVTIITLVQVYITKKDEVEA